MGGRKRSEPHRCRNCAVVVNEDGSNFPKRIVDGKRYFRHLCRVCFNRQTKVRQRTNGARERHTGRKMARQTMERLTGVNPAKYILSDSRKQDRQRGFENDLDIPFISALIEKGCEYCGAKNLRMSLDRVDNSMGHTKENVKPACRRCNWIRRDMPYEAWVRLVPTLHEIQTEGLWGQWSPGPSKAVLAVDVEEHTRVAESADAPGSGPGGLRAMEVQVLS
jgi:ribosomal protein L36